MIRTAVFYKKAVWVFVLLAGSLTLQAQPYRIYLLLNTRSCSNCVLMSKQLRANTVLFPQTEFLFSSEEITYRQAKAFLDNLFATPCRVVIDDSLYAAFTEQLGEFKIPYMIVFDEGNKRVVQITGMDQFVQEAGKIAKLTGLQQQADLQVYDIPQVQNLFGQKYIQVSGEYVMIIAYMQMDKAYIFNTRTHQLDSVVVTDSLVNHLIRKNNMPYQDAGRIHQFYEKLNLPYHIAVFAWRQNADDRYFYLTLDMLLMNPDSPRTEINPDWHAFQVRYEPATGKIQYDPFKWWEDTVRINGERRMSMDQMFRAIQHDSILISGGDMLSPDPNIKHKLLIGMRKNKAGKFEYASTISHHKIGPIHGFNGQHLNESHHAYPYCIRGRYLYFELSPMIYDTVKKELYDIRKINPLIDWLYDLDVDGKDLKLLVREKTKLVLYTLDEKTKSLIDSISLQLNYKNCEPRMTRDRVVWLDVEGRIYHYPLKH